MKTAEQWLVEPTNTPHMTLDKIRAIQQDARKSALVQAQAELARAAKKQPINTHIRLFGLVRFMRSELHEQGLITDEEYGDLCAGPMATSPEGGSPSPRRLEDYDTLKQQLTSSQQRVRELEKDFTRLVEHSIRIKCGCFQRDCAKHGSWVSEDIEWYQSLLIPPTQPGKEGV